MQKQGDINDDMDDKFDAVDRISQLPEFIIHHIMSFLCPKDVARTSVLSKRWNNLWSSFPILEFKQREFNKKLSFWNRNGSPLSPEIQETRERFMSFVDGSLRRFNEQRMCMQKFVLDLTLDLKLASRVDKWIGLAIENNVKKLIIHLSTNLNEWYHLPETVFASKSITFLNIYGCKLELPSGNSIKFSSLKILHLREVYVDEDMIQNFICSCPLIKNFNLVNPWGIRKFHLSKLPYLESVIVRTGMDILKEVYVAAPRLKVFYFNFSTICDSCAIDVAASQDLKRLFITYRFITELLLHNLISNFPNLEELRLCDSDMLERIAISSLKLKRLTISRCRKLVVADIDAPNLLFFNYNGAKMPILSSKSALCQWEIELDADNLNSHWFLKLREFLDNLNCRKFLNLYIRYDENTFDLEELGEKSLPLPYELEHLTLKMQTRSSNSSQLVDGLFWCCHPKTISIESGYGCNNIFIKLLVEKLMDIEVRSCCSSGQIKCWLHYLEEVAIESFEGTSDERFHDWNTLLDALPTLVEGQKLCFRFNWRSYFV